MSNIPGGLDVKTSGGVFNTVSGMAITFGYA